MKEKLRKAGFNDLNKFIVSIITAIVVVLITQEFFFTITPLKKLELNFIDSHFQERGEINLADTSNIVIVEITQESYDQIPPPYNNWPWPRSLFAKLVKNLNEAGVKAIGLDLVMSNSDQYSDVNDSLLYSVIKKYKNVVVAGKVDIEREAQLENVGDNSRTKSNKDKGVLHNKIENYSNIFYGADSSVGVVQIPTDDDGVIRRYNPYVYSNVTEKRIPSFGFALLNEYYDKPSGYTVKVVNNNFNFLKKKIPAFDKNTMLINYFGPDNTFPRYKLINIIDDKGFKTTDEITFDTDINTWDNPDYGLLYSGVFKNKIVIVGSTMPEDKDLFPTSFGKGKREGDNLMYGVEIHANAVQDVISGQFLERQSTFVETLLIVFLTLLTFYFSTLLKQIKSKYGFLLEVIAVLFTAGLIYFIYNLSSYLFTDSNYIIPIVSPSLAVAFGYLSSTTYNFITERRENAFIKGMFSQYVSSTVVNELLSDPERLRLGGEKKELTVLFSDISGFTNFSEKMKPEELVEFINEYLSEMSEIIISESGTLDKYLGDAVMAFWGAPIEIEEHALKACTTAVKMQNKLNQLRDKWHKEGQPDLNIRIGINTGDVVVGNVGGKKRFDYTVMGDNVNLASRLEGANKEYGTSVMISESTFSKITGKVIVRELDTIRVKGKTKPTKVFELFGLIDDHEAVKKYNSLDRYFKGLDEYKLRNFDEAARFFEECITINKFDNPSNVYLERCKYYLQNPPSEDWDGVFTLKTK